MVELLHDIGEAIKYLNEAVLGLSSLRKKFDTLVEALDACQDHLTLGDVALAHPKI